MSASPNLKCGLCNDFLVNAVTVAGCMHSFCEECLLKSLSVSGTCPTKGCKKNVDKNGYRHDSTLQMLVYKFVPQRFFENAEKGSRGNADANNRKTQ
ncbi:zinc finger, C3HC4 type, partial [Cooperia oncophora]